MPTRAILERVPRESLSARIEALDLPQAKAYADFIRTGDAGGPVPCWGAIAERFDRDFKKTADRKALWNALVEEGDRRPLLLYLHVNRGRPQVLAQIVEEAADLLPAHLDKLHPAARQLFEAGPEALAREAEVVEARIAQLTAFRYFVPDPADPANEPAAVTDTGGGP